jgi:hypothetical protein
MNDRVIEIIRQAMHISRFGNGQLTTDEEITKFRAEAIYFAIEESGYSVVQIEKPAR